jgi:hypothetical protein
MDWLSTVLDHWRPLAMSGGAIGALRLVWKILGSLGVAIWERDQLRRQVKFLEHRVTQLESTFGVEDSESASSASSSAAPGTIPTSTPPTPRS